MRHVFFRYLKALNLINCSSFIDLLKLFDCGLTLYRLSFLMVYFF
jgi:hypothetical protein